MFSAIFLCGAVIGQAAAPAGDRKAELAVYESAKAVAGDNADAHARLALWCEAHGLSAERLKQLALAVKCDPTYELARGLLGLVAYQGKWERPEVIGQRIHDDPAGRDVIRAYLDRRVATPDTAAAQIRLAAWCEQKGLKDQALAHYNDAIRLDPSREDVWKHLGYQKRGNRWLKADEIAAQEQQVAWQKVADRRWRPVLERLRSDLESSDPAKRARALQRLTEITDPRAMPMIWALFVRGNERREIAAVGLLSQIDSPAAAHGLAALAVFSPRSEVRERAKQALKRVDARDVAESLIDLMHTPFKYQVRSVNGLGFPGELFVEGELFNVQRFYQNQTIVPALWGGRMFSPAPGFDTLGTPLGSEPPATSRAPLSQSGQAVSGSRQNTISGQAASGIVYPSGGRISPFMLMVQDPGMQQDLGMTFQLQKSREMDQGLQRRLARDVQIIEATNAGISLLNARARTVLNAITGRDLGDDPEQWRSWWSDELGYAYRSSSPQSKPTYTAFVTEPILPQRRHSACFAAGTLVRTADGSSSIETLRVGDLVLSQNTSSGSLEFQPVVAVHNNKPAAVLRLEFGGGTIVATGIHRFWKAGKGWTMARELRTGDRVRGLGGVVAVQSIAEETIQPVFNLEVARNRDYFVGPESLLVHDYSFVQPVGDPFDREPDLAALAPAAH